MSKRSTRGVRRALGTAAVVVPFALAMPAGACLADLNGDGGVDVQDLFQMLGAAGPCQGCPEDLNGDDVVDIVDIAYLLESWGTPCVDPDPGTLELFDEIVIVDATTPDAVAAGLLVTHVYATGSDVEPGHALLAVGQADIAVDSSTFFQHGSGTNAPPESFLFDFFPTLPYDTFATANALADGDVLLFGMSMNETSLTGGWAGPPDSTSRDAIDIGGITGVPGQAGVLIAQITLLRDCDPAPAYSGTTRLFTSALDGGSLEGIEVPLAFAYECSCPADLDGDGVVGVADLIGLLMAWGPNPGHPADFNGDGMVDEVDLAFFLASWETCEPIPGDTELFDQVVAIDTLDPAAEEQGLIVTHLYATGDQVEVGHRLLMVSQADIAVFDGSFFQFPLAFGNMPPDSSLFGTFPLLRYDTFGAVNELQDDEHAYQTPGTFMDESAISGGWFAIPTAMNDQRAAVDISGLTGVPGQAGVLIGQLTLVPTCTDPLLWPSYAGTIRLFTSSLDGGTVLGIDATVEYERFCPDTNGDGVVNVDDHLAVLGGWGDNPGHPGDVNGDGVVDVDDHLLVLGRWGPCVPCTR